jgi:hypothetical protein
LLKTKTQTHFVRNEAHAAAALGPRLRGWAWLAFFAGGTALKTDLASSGDSEARFVSAGDRCVDNGASMVAAEDGVGGI